MSKLVFLQGAESVCEVNGFKNVDAVTRVGAEQRLSTLSAKDRYCEAGASKIGLCWLDGRYCPNVKSFLLSSKSPSSPPLDVGASMHPLSYLRGVSNYEKGAYSRLI